MPTFETDQPIVLAIEMSHGAAHVIASDRTDAVVAVNPRDRGRPEDVEATERIAVDLANGVLAIRAPKSRGIAAPLRGVEARRLRRGDRGGPCGVIAARRCRCRRRPVRWPSR
jgi:hypothetical protein